MRTKKRIQKLETEVSRLNQEIEKLKDATRIRVFHCMSCESEYRFDQILGRGYGEYSYYDVPVKDLIQTILAVLHRKVEYRESQPAGYAVEKIKRG